MGVVFDNAEVLLCIPVKEKEMAKGLAGKNTETAGSRSDPVLHGKILLPCPSPDPCWRCSLCLQSLCFRYRVKVSSSNLCLHVHSCQHREWSCKYFVKGSQAASTFFDHPLCQHTMNCSCLSKNEHVSSTMENSAIQHPNPDRPHSSGPIVTSVRATCALAPLTVTQTHG